MSRRTVRQTTLWLIVGLILLSCGTPVLVAPPPSVSEPGSVETVIVQTAAAAQTQTLVSLPPTNTPTFTPLATRTPTVTPTPTATILFLFPTATSLPVGSLDNGSSTSSGGSLSNTSGNNNDDEKVLRRQLWACRVISKSPADETVVIGGTSVKTIWTVENTGTETWPKKSVDVVYISGTRLNEGKPYYDIPGN